MNQATIERLANMKDELCVSIILPITKLPDRRIENTIRLNNLVNEARHQLHKKYKNGIETIDKKLDQQTKLFPQADLKAGMAIFVSNTVSECIPLQFEVKEAVSVQESFRLRELLYSHNENIEFYLLVLSETKSSLYKGQGTDLVELHKSFPLQNTVQDSSVESVQSGKPASRWLLGSINGDATVTPGTYVPNTDSIQEERLKNFFREVDTRLEERLKQLPLPVILLSVERNAALYKEISASRKEIVQEVYGSMDHASNAELLEVIQPALARYRSRSKECKLQALEIARSKNLLASGIRESWYHSTRGRIESLYLDMDLKISGFEQEPGLFINEDSAAKGTGTFYSDALEELIARVFKTSGDIIFADSGTLKNFEGVAAILRY